MSERLQGKIALEEHFYLPSYEAYGADGDPLDGASKAHNYLPDFFASVQRGLSDIKLRLEEMDRGGIERMVLSLTQPGIQGIPDRKIAIDTAKRMNDELALIVEAHPKQFLASPPCRFRMCARPPLMSQRRAYEGYEVLAGSPWGFGAETSLHTLRLILSGLFDRFPRLQVILGHLGEGLPFLLPRVEARLRHMSLEVRGKQQKPVTSYLRENFYITTAGHLRTQAFIDTLLEVGSDRVLYSVDYPYESVKEQNDWFDGLPISETDRRKIGRENALKLLRLGREHADVTVSEKRLQPAK